jgi:1,4-dihydroxy-2-naphthoate polyprenyltransferase|uniref:1,4-dihydroxy-2-naphthoate polyprenyltransferase n=1 Tax=Candidatus Planktophila sp. TaxID=2175601 RepID=UPI004049843D
MNKWVAGARPKTLPAAIAPVAVGTALAGSDFDPMLALLALLVSLSLQVGVNYANDYSDGVKGTDDNRIGPMRLVASGAAPAHQVKIAAYLALSSAAVFGLILALQTTLWFIAIGALAIAAAWGYTGWKNPYGYFGFGELAVFVFFGLVATMGTYYAQTGELTLNSLFVAIPMGSLSCALLAINNLRDRAADELVGKRTLAVRLGDASARRAFISLLLIAHISVLFLMKPWILLTLLLLPMTFSLIKAIRAGAQGAQLIPLLGKTGKLQLRFAILLSLGLLLG